MDRRSLAVAAAVVLLAINLTLVVSVAYPFSEKQPRPASEAFHPPGTGAGAYHLSASIETDGETTLEVEGAAEASGERYVRIVQEDAIVERYRPPDGSVPDDAAPDDAGPEYARYVVDATSFDDRLQRLESDPGREVVASERDGDAATIVTFEENPDADAGDELSGAASVVATQLRLVQYSTVESGDRHGRSVLRPTDGWYEGTEPYRIAGASGTVEVDDGTGVVYAATVRWDLTRGTRTSLHYLMNRDATVSQEISFEYRTDDVDVDPPDWVD